MIKGDEKKYVKPVKAEDWNEYWLSNRREILDKNIKDSPWYHNLDIWRKTRTYDRQMKNMHETEEYAPFDNRFKKPDKKSLKVFGKGSVYDVYPENNTDVRYYSDSLDAATDRDEKITVYNQSIFKHPISNKLSPNEGVSDELIVHERSHAQDPRPQESAIRRRKPFFFNSHRSDEFTLDKYKDKRGSVSKYVEYLDSDPEIYARLQEFRFRNNLNPKYTVTTDDIKGWRNVQKKKEIKDDFLQNYNDDFLLYLFNEVASNDKPKSDRTALARNGSKLIRRKNYGR